MMKATEPGVYEYELASLFEYICKKELFRFLEGGLLTLTILGYSYFSE